MAVGGYWDGNRHGRPDEVLCMELDGRLQLKRMNRVTFINSQIQGFVDVAGAVELCWRPP